MENKNLSIIEKKKTVDEDPTGVRINSMSQETCNNRHKKLNIA